MRLLCALLSFFSFAYGLSASEQGLNFEAIHQCQTNLYDQTKRLSTVFENIRQIKCFDSEEQLYFDTLINQLYTDLDSFAITHSNYGTKSPQTIITPNALDTQSLIFAKYIEIQSLVSLCRSTHIVKGAQDSKFKTEISDNLFLVALGDAFGKGSGFEGSTSEVTLGHRLKALKRIQEATQGLDFIRDSAQTHPCADLGLHRPSQDVQLFPDLPQAILTKLIQQTEVALSLFTAFRGPIRDLSKTLEKQLFALKKDESLFLPFGWTKHAFAFQITKENGSNNEATYNFRIFNSGEGIGTYHASAQSGYVTQYFPYLEIINVPHRNLLSPVILKAFQEVAHPEAYKTTPEQLYQQIFQRLGGKKNPVAYDVSAFRDVQKSGTCSYFSLRWVLDSCVEQIIAKNDLFKSSKLPSRVEALIDSLTLDLYAQQLVTRGITKTNDEQYRLLQKGLTYLAATTLQNSINNNADIGDVMFLAKMGGQISTTISLSESQRRNLQYTAKDVAIAPKTKMAAPITTRNVWIFDPIQPLNTASRGHAVIFDFENWQPRRKKDALIADLDDIIDRLTSAQSAGYFFHVTTAIAAIAARFELHKRDFWKGTTDSRAIALISCLRKLQALYSFSLAKGIANLSFRKQGLTTKDLLVAIKLLAISDFLNQNFISSIKPQLPSLAQNHFAWILSKESRLIGLTDPKWIRQLEILRSYFAVVPKDSFFGLDTIPAGVFLGSEHRVFHDEKATSELENDKFKHFEKNKWRFFDWATEVIKGQSSYDSWFKQRILENEQKSISDVDYISPFELRWWDKTASDFSSIDLALNPDFVEAKPVTRIETELLRREVLKLIAANEAPKTPFDEMSLPRVFYDLRAISFLVDWLLTGQLDEKSVKHLSFADDLRFSSTKSSATLNQYTGKSRHFLFRNAVRKCAKTSQDQGACLEDAAFQKEISKEIYEVKHVEFKATILKFEIFGGQLGNDAYQLDERYKTPFVYTRPYVHAQRAIRPFNEANHADLARIYSTGIKLKNGHPVFDPLMEQERRRILPNNIIALNPGTENIKELTLQRIREIFTLSGIKELQLAETLALFDQFPSLLLHNEYQRIFEDLMLEDNLFEKELQVSEKETERFLEKIIRFCEAHFQVISKRGDLKAMTFILRMSQYFKTKWEFAKSQPETRRRTNYNPPFYNTPQKLYDEAKKLDSSRWKEKSYLYRNIVESLANAAFLTSLDVELLLIAFIEHKALAITDPKWHDPFSESIVSLVLREKQPLIQRQILDENGTTLSAGGQQILTSVVQAIRSDLTLSSNFRINSLAIENGTSSSFSRKNIKPSVFEVDVTSSTGPTKISIDISSGSFFEQGQTIAPFPLSISQYQERFGSEAHPSVVQQIDLDTYSWKGSSGRTYRIKRSHTGNDWIYQMLFGEGPRQQWYQYVPESDLDFSNQGFFSGHDHWQSAQGKHSTQEFLIFAKDTKELAFTTELQCAIFSSTSCVVSSTIRHKDRSWLSFLGESDFPKNILKQIEHPLYIYVWLTAPDNGRIKEVEIPRLNLTFKPLNDSNRLDCAQFSGFQISAIQYSGVLNQPVNYLICDATEHSSTKRIAITPIEPFELEMEKSTLSPFAFSSSRHFVLSANSAMHSSGTDLAVYELPPLHDGIEKSDSIVPNSDVARLYLAMRQQWQLNYDAAKKNIDVVTNGDRSLSAERKEISVLNWIIAESRIDADPRSTIAILLSAINLLKQSLYFDGPKYQAIRVKDIYLTYLSNLELLPEDALNIFDELLLARALERDLANTSDLKSQRTIAHRLLFLSANHPQSKFPAPTRIDIEVQSPPHNPTSFSQTPFLDIADVIKKIYQGTSTQVGASVLETSSIIAPINFDFLYEIARGVSFDQRKARELLSTIIGDTLVTEMTAQDIRQEWVQLFALNAMSTNNCADLARFLFLLSQLPSRTNAPSAAELRQVWDLDKKIAQFKIEMGDLTYKIGDEEKSLLKCEYESGTSFIYRNIISPIWNLIYCNSFLMSNSRLRDFYKRKYELVRYNKVLDTDRSNFEADFKQRLFSQLKNLVIPQVKFEPVIISRDVPVRNPIPFNVGTSVNIAPESSRQILLGELSDPLRESLLSTDSPIFEAYSFNPLQQFQMLIDLSDLKSHLEIGLKGPKQVALGIGSLNKRLDAYVAKKIFESESYLLRNPSSIDDLIESIIQDIEKEQNALKTHTNRIMALAKHYNSKKDATYHGLLRLANVARDLSLEELGHLLCQRELSDLAKATAGHLDGKQLSQLKNEIASSLLISTYLTHAKAYLSALVQLNEMIDRGEPTDSQAFQTGSNLVVQLGQQKRAYNPQQFPEYLMLEQYMGFLLRGDQVSILDELVIKDGVATNEKALGAVIEMIMGAGKTSVLLPLLSLFNSRDGAINVVMLPEALVSSMSKQLALQLSKGFGSAVDIIKIERETSLGEFELSILYDRFVKAQTEHRTIVMTNRTMQSLFLSFLASLHYRNKGFHTYEKSIEQFIRIFQLLRTHGRLTIDEVDTALDVLQSHQFSLGNRVPINKTLSATVLAFYRQILAGNYDLRLPFVQRSKGNALTALSYRQIQEQLIQDIASNEHFFKGMTSLEKSYRYFISDVQHQRLLKTYLGTQTYNDRTKLFHAIDLAFAQRPEEIEAMKTVAAVLFEEINKIFLLTSSKKLTIHYGPLPIPVRNKDRDESETAFLLQEREYQRSRFIAIPYHAGNPVPNSRFGTAIEALNYTIQMHIELRNFLPQIEMEVETLKRLVSHNDPRFEERFDKLRKGIQKSIFAMESEDIKHISQQLASNPDAEYEFALLFDYVLPQLTTYETQLQTNAHVYEALFASVQGFSGTLWSINTFPRLFLPPILSDTTEKTLFTLWSQYSRMKEKDPSYLAVQTYSKEGFATEFHWKQNSSFIDEGGLFRGIDNALVAKNMSRATGQDVIFYDNDNNVQVCLTKAQGEKSIPIEEPQVSRDSRIAFWDKKHTTGSDLKLAQSMDAQVSFDHHLLSRDLQQSVWRLRGLRSGQKITNYIALQEDLDVIKQRMQDLLNHRFDTFDLGELILYSVVNQETILSDLLFRSVKLKMKNAFVKQVLDNLFRDNGNSGLARLRYGHAESLFEKTANERPYLDIGFPAVLENKDTILSCEKNMLLDSDLTHALENSNLFENGALKGITDELQSVIDATRHKLPDMILAGDSTAESEIEIELALERENEMEEETEREIESFEFNPEYKPVPLLKWHLNEVEDVFEPAYFDPIPISALSIWKNNLKANRPILTLRQALETNGHRWLASSINSQLLVSLNFAPLHNSAQPYDFFSLYQKNLTNILAILDPQGNLSLMLIDNVDAQFFDLIIKQDHQLESSIFDHRKVRLALYNVTTGIFRTGRDPIENWDLYTHPQFVQMLAQVKFLNGELSYTQSEIDFLADWIGRVGVDKMYNFFSKRVLAYKQESRDLLAYSPIGKLFNDLWYEN